MSFKVKILPIVSNHFYFAGGARKNNILYERVKQLNIYLEIRTNDTLDVLNSKQNIEIPYKVSSSDVDPRISLMRIRIRLKK